MAGARRTRRALLGAAVVGGVLVSETARGAARPSHELTDLARRVQALSLASPGVDYEDPRAEAAYYATAASILEAVIATRVTTLPGLRIKAEALVWCYGGRPVLGPEPTTAERIVASMLADLLGPDPAAKENKRRTRT